MQTFTVPPPKRRDTASYEDTASSSSGYGECARYSSSVDMSLSSRGGSRLGDTTRSGSPGVAFCVTAAPFFGDGSPDDGGDGVASGVAAHVPALIAALMPSLRAAIVAPTTAHGPMAAEAASEKAGWCSVALGGTNVKCLGG